MSHWSPAERVAAAVSGGVAVWWGVEQIWGDLPYTGYINAFGIWWALAAAMAGVCLLWHRRWAGIAAIGLSGAIALQGGALATGAFPAARMPQGSRSFRVVTASLRNQNSDMASAASALLATRPDVLVLQEAHVGELMSLLDAGSASAWNYVNNKNEIIACRCPVRARRELDRILSADVVLGDGAVRVWNVRAPKYYATPHLNEVYFRKLAMQVQSVDTGIVAGDFNATPWNDGYRIIAGTARDAWKDAGFGLGLTFSTPARHLGMVMPLVSIDHVFVKGKLRVMGIAVRPAGTGADHYPVVADLMSF